MAPGLPKSLVVQSPSTEADQSQWSLTWLARKRCSALSQAQWPLGLRWFVSWGSNLFRTGREQPLWSSGPLAAALTCHSNRGGITVGS